MPVPVQLPGDEVAMERAIAGAIKTALATVPYIGPIHVVERFPESDEDDVALTTVESPSGGAGQPLTNVVEIGTPSVFEVEYTSDENTQLTFVYPITYSLGVVDEWAVDNFPFTNSGEMFLAVYMRARRAIKQDRTLGFINCVHFYLQQENAGILTNDKGEALEHFADWSLTVVVTGCRY